MVDKLGTYINTLMTTILNKEQEQFVKDLAWDELRRLSANIEEFLRKHSADDSKDRKKTEKILLQEESKDGNN